MGSNGSSKKNTITVNGKTKRLKDNRKVDLDKLFSLITINPGITYEEIGKIMGGVSKQAIHQNLELLKLTRKDLPRFVHYRENKALHLERQQLNIITTLDEGETKGRDRRDEVVALATLIDKQQLLQGRPTSIEFGLIAHVKANNERNTEDVSPEPPIETECKDITGDDPI